MTRVRATTATIAALASLVLIALAACAHGGVSESVVSPTSRAPVVLARVPALGRPAAGPAPPSGEARATVDLGAVSLVATTTGLFARDGAAWSAIDRGGAPVTAVVELARGEGGVSEAWAREPGSLWRVRIEGQRASWFRAPFPPSIGAVRAMAPVGTRLALATDRGVAFIDGDFVRLVRAREGEPPPVALAGAGGAAWVAWGDAILRTDGVGWTALARGLAFGPTPRIVADDDGATATFQSSANGETGALRIVGDEGVRLDGIPGGARVADTRLALAAVPAQGTELIEVDYAVDGARVASRTAAPWGWGSSGAPGLDLAALRYGHHVVRVDAKTARGRPFVRTVAFAYVPPASGVPSYARDVVPLFRDHCATCHDHGLARDLATYVRLRSIGARLRASVREQRMPPDFALDPASVAVFTAWVDGDSPP